MKILVVAATIAEISPALPFLEEHQIDYLITGVGMVAATYTMTKQLQKHRPDLILQVGIGGVMDTSARLGEIYRVHSDEIFGFGAEDRGAFIPIEKLGFGKGRYAEHAPPDYPLPKIKEATGITVNTVHGAAESIQQLQQQYTAPLIESMEGVAAFLVAEQEGIPCLQYRAVSNYIEPRDRDTWNTGLAISNLNNFLLDFLNRITKY